MIYFTLLFYFNELLNHTSAVKVVLKYTWVKAEVVIQSSAWVEVEPKFTSVDFNTSTNDWHDK